MTWLDLGFFLILLALFIYVFVTNTITILHKVYLLFHFFMMLWPLGQFAVHTTTNPVFQHLYINVSFAGLSMLGFGWLLFTKFLTDETYLLTRKTLLRLLLPSLAVVMLLLWNPAGIFMTAEGGSYVERRYGPAFWLMVAMLGAYFLESFRLLWLAYRSDRSVHNRPHIGKAITGMFVLAFFALLDIVFNVVLARWLPIIPGFTSFGILISDILFVFSLQRYRMFDIVKIAQQDVFDTMSAGVVVLDKRDRIVEMNRTALQRLGVKAGHRLNIERLLESVRPEGDPASFLAAYRMDPPERAQLEVAVTYGGSRFYFSLQAAPIMVRKQAAGRVITLQDITELRRLINESKRHNEALQERNRALMYMQDELFQANRKLEHMAITDSLTGCYNRRYLMQLLEQEVVTNIRLQAPFAIFLFDIDLFKKVNDTFGHLAGDEVIRETAGIVRRTLRGSDILARYGGEEFTVYLPHTDGMQAEMLAQRVRKAVESNRIEAGDNRFLSVTISMGVLAVDPVPNAAAEDPKAYLRGLFARADAALYRAKDNGRNRVVHMD
ncbi:diguanylate cyclase [Paenibacillus humicola]|uniref:histidine kinase N-terminal 7TM domain-containing diguanylate cyclase n=1 Tax=Paenibacillus humicola TaxID=3110540 RepID=UPI00237B1AF6|nr:diguanylate cyclase [Paenibacillus humicola]